MAPEADNLPQSRRRDLDQKCLLAATQCAGRRYGRPNATNISKFYDDGQVAVTMAVNLIGFARFGEA